MAAASRQPIGWFLGCVTFEATHDFGGVGIIIVIVLSLYLVGGFEPLPLVHYYDEKVRKGGFAHFLFSFYSTHV